MRFNSSLKKALVLFQVEANKALSLDSHNMAEFVSPSLLESYITLGQILLSKNIYGHDQSRNKK